MPSSSPGLVRRILPKLVVSLALGSLFAWLYARGGIPLIPDRAAFDQLTWWAIPAFILLQTATHLVRAVRWRHLVEPIKHLPLKEVIVVNWIGFFAIFALPLRLGEVARPALCKARDAIPLSAGFGTIAVERVLDGLVTSFAVAWALFALPRLDVDDPLARALPGYGYVALMVFGGAFVALGFFLWQRKWATHMTRKVFGLVSAPLGETLAEKVSSVADGVRSLGDARLAGAFFVETLLYWGLNAAGMWVLAVGCGIPATFEHAVAIMGILAIGILLPAGPGLFGAFQLAVLLALKLYFPADLVASEGVAYIFLLYVTQATMISLAGILPLYALEIPLGSLLARE